MRMCPVNDIQDGDVLGKSIFLSNNRLLLGAGYRISNDIRRKLLEKGYSHVYIMEEGTEDVIPEDVISDEVRHDAKIHLEDSVNRIKRAAVFQQKSIDKVRETLEKGNLQNVVITYDLKKVVTDILRDITAGKVRFMNTIFPKSKDTAFFDHAINTAVLAILIGKRYRFTVNELTPLALGAFLHDIGKVIIEQMVEKSSGGKPDDFCHEHPTFGYLLLKNDKSLSPLVLQTVNQHHERQDGNGFPIGLKGNNSPPVKEGVHQASGTIFRFAEICTVADAYDRMLLSPVNGEKMSPSDVIKELLRHAGTTYNSNIVETLTGLVPAYPVGSFVRIAEIVDPSLIGCYGVVAKVNDANLQRPTIIVTANKYRKKIKPIIVDTAKLSRIELKLIM